MMNDINLSQTLIKEYREENKDGEEISNAISVEVLTNGHWADQKPIVCKIPKELTVLG
jgi:hypothetical protein